LLTVQRAGICCAAAVVVGPHGHVLVAGLTRLSQVDLDVDCVAVLAAIVVADDEAPTRPRTNQRTQARSLPVERVGRLEGVVCAPECACECPLSVLLS
jgi:hypothetical protein